MSIWYAVAATALVTVIVLGIGTARAAICTQSGYIGPTDTVPHAGAVLTTGVEKPPTPERVAVIEHGTAPHAAVTTMVPSCSLTSAVHVDPTTGAGVGVGVGIV